MNACNVCFPVWPCATPAAMAGARDVFLICSVPECSACHMHYELLTLHLFDICSWQYTSPDGFRWPVPRMCLLFRPAGNSSSRRTCSSLSLHGSQLRGCVTYAWAQLTYFAVYFSRGRERCVKATTCRAVASLSSSSRVMQSC